MADGDTKSQDDVKLTEDPPVQIGGILMRLGPGLIVAGSIVGSGELIATTKTGAEAGFWLLWLILIGCVIKVFVQVEFGRYAVTFGKTALAGMNELPGPRVGSRGNWLVWYWFIMFVATLAQLGGIVGGVGQALAISVPVTADGRLYNEYADRRTQHEVDEATLRLDIERGSKTEDEIADLRAKLATLKTEADEAEAALRKSRELGPDDDINGPPDARIWATILAILTAVVLYMGRYGFIQSFSTVLVASFTLLTVINVCLLQSHETWGVSMQEFINGMSFRLPKGDSGQAGIATALATFGIIGVGASELVTYPYWCLEKGYARFTGTRDKSEAWAYRAQGWMRVMRWDAWCSMVVYTFATIAFYLLGAATLGRIGLGVGGRDMVRTLGVMYEPVFGSIAQVLFLFGAFAVLYSTYFVANASHARTFPDALRVLGFLNNDEKTYRKAVRNFSAFFPFACLFFFLVFPSNPEYLVLLSGVLQAVMLPMLAGAALYFRYKRCDSRLIPGKAWDIFLWLSALGMLITGSWTLWDKVKPKNNDTDPPKVEQKDEADK